jgi:uncharacterized protein (DUF2336 family)
VAVRGLSFEDVNRLATDPSVATRAGTAVLLAQQFDTQVLKPAEIKLAHEIFLLMIRDAEVRVREALSANLKDNPHVPHDVAAALAKDVDSVSLPILAYSEVLTTADLVEIVNAQASAGKMEAIAGRKSVVEPLSAALVERGNDKVVARLMNNPGAVVSEVTLHRAVDRFGDSEIVLDPLVKRATLPATVAERLVTRVADHLRTQLLAKHKISADVAIDLVLQTRERATAGLAMGLGEDALRALVHQLRDNGRLTSSLVLRTICMGNLRFFEHALAALAGIPVTNARVLVHEGSGAGLRALWIKAGLNENAYPAIRAAVDAISQVDLAGHGMTTDRFSRRVLERVLTQHDVLEGAIDADDLDFLMDRIGATVH